MLKMILGNSNIQVTFWSVVKMEVEKFGCCAKYPRVRSLDDRAPVFWNEILLSISSQDMRLEKIS